MSIAREVGVVFKHELRSLLLSARTLLPMGIYAGFGALAVFIFQSISRGVEQKLGGVVPKDPREFEEGLQAAVAAVFKFTGWGGEGDVAEIFRDHVPMLVLYFFVLASYFLPMLVALVSFDQFSDLSTRGARFALLRVRRESYLAGKSLAAVAAVALFLLVTWIVIGGVAAARGGAGEVPFAVREGLRAWALMTVLALPYLSITALISSLTRPGLAFIGTLGAWIGLSVGDSLVHWLLPAQVSGVITQIFPWEHAHKLVSRYGPTLTSGVVALVLIALAGYALTLVVVRRRDV